MKASIESVKDEGEIVPNRGRIGQEPILLEVVV